MPRAVTIYRGSQQLCGVCADGLERRLAGELYGRERWKRWVDGVLPATDLVPEAVMAISAVEVNLRGFAIWEIGRGPAWIEPFFGIVRLSQTSDAILGYELRFADADRALGNVTYGKHVRRVDCFFPPEWLMTFSEGVFKEARLQ
jgi:hypothetical protein